MRISNTLCSYSLELESVFLAKLHLYGDRKYENKVNKKILLASINFILSSKQFEDKQM